MRIVLHENTRFCPGARTTATVGRAAAPRRLYAGGCCPFPRSSPPYRPAVARPLSRGRGRRPYRQAASRPPTVLEATPRASRPDLAPQESPVVRVRDRAVVRPATGPGDRAE